MLNLSYTMVTRSIEASLLFILCLLRTLAHSVMNTNSHFAPLCRRKNKFHRRFDRSVLRCLSIVSTMLRLHIDGRATT